MDAQQIVIKKAGGPETLSVESAAVPEPGPGEVQVEVPVVVRLEGTNAEQGLAMLAASDLAITTAASLSEAADKVVAAAGAKH